MTNTYLASLIENKMEKSRSKSGLTKEEIAERNRASKRKHYQEGKANGAPWYCAKIINKRCQYWKRLQNTLTPVEFMTRLAKLKLRSQDKYEDVCQFLNI